MDPVLSQAAWARAGALSALTAAGLGVLVGVLEQRRAEGALAVELF